MPLITTDNRRKTSHRLPLHSALISVFCLSLGFGSGLSSAVAEELPLMPYPQQLERLEGHFFLDAGMAIGYDNEATEQALVPAIERFTQRLERQTGIALAGLEPGDQCNQLHIHVAELIAPHQNMEQMTPEQEAYRLHIDAHGIHLKAQTQFGVYHGLETLLQLAGTDEGRQVLLPSVSIEDQPRFPWRGLLLDSSRHFFSVETIKRQLDGMAAAKLNVFHWHLTDDQGWRMESRAYPKLHQEAANGQYYTREEIREVVAYAAERGIQVMPEIDMPGHSTAIGVAYPELMSQPGPYAMEEHWGVHRPLLNPANDAVYEFARAIFAEVAELFPFDYVHIGGDEVDPRDWEENPEIQTYRESKGLADSEALHAYFNQRISDILADLDRKMIGWDEVLHPDLPRHTAVQSWRGADSLGQAAQAGHPAILSTGFYLDQPQPAGYHYRNRFFAQPLEGRDQAAPDEHWETWQFELPRKRGSAITGRFTLIEDAEGPNRGFIDFDGRSRQRVNNLSVQLGYTRFELDTWMGPVRARLSRDDDQLSGHFIVGNAPYRAYGERGAHSQQEGAEIQEGIKPFVLDADSRERVLGGEIALWSEIINEDSIDRRLWPRAFAVAERLWSSAERRDEEAMYQRLQTTSNWSAISVELLHEQQMQQGIERLVTAEQYPAALVLAEALEPAQYYHRHHEKSAYESYSRQDPLDRYVDALPSESYAVRDWARTLTQWLEQPEENALYGQLYSDLKRWNHHARALLDAIAEQGDPGALAELAEQVRTTTAWGLVLMESLVDDSQIDSGLLRRARSQLRTAQDIEQEIVIALAYPVEQLLEHQLLRQQPTTASTPANSNEPETGDDRVQEGSLALTNDWVAEGTFTDGIEGPALGPDGALYAVNHERQGTIGRVTGLNQSDTFLDMPEGSIANAIRFDRDGFMWVADYAGHNLFKFDPESRELLKQHHHDAMHQPNDIAVARSGWIYASDPNWVNETGQLWALSPEGKFVQIEADVGTTNGIELSPDETRLYVNESVQRRLYQYDVEPDGSLSNKRELYQFVDAGLDGMKVDSAGNLYIARYGAGTLAVFTPEGRRLPDIPLHGRYPTNLALEENGETLRFFVTMQQRGNIETFEMVWPDPDQTHLGDLLSNTRFDQMFPERDELFSYSGLLAASRQFPAFGTTGDDTTRKREIAAALANFHHETGGLYYRKEIHRGDYCSDTGTACGVCAPGKQYFGRGPIQLSWNGNYCDAGRALNLDLWGQPELVAENPSVAWQTALWYWMTREGPGTMTSHNAMVDGHGFGETIRSINGRLECDGGNPGQVQSRIELYRTYTRALEATPGDNLDC